MRHQRSIPASHPSFPKRDVASVCSDVAPVCSEARQRHCEEAEQGYLLIGLVIAIFLIALFLTIAAPTVAKQLERDRELESGHRAQQYVRAIQNYYVKFNRYPTTVEQLLNQNDQHFLRQEYKDPLTGGDYRLIHFGEAKTTVKGFFGEELQGVPQGGNLGSLAGSASDTSTTHTFGSGGQTGGGPGSSNGSSGNGSSFGSGTGSGFGSGAGPSFGSGSGSGPGFGSTSSAGGPGGGSGPGVPGQGATSPGSPAGSGTGSGSTLGGTSATQFQGSKGAIVGVGSNKTGAGLVEWNGSANMEDWEFLFDPRVLAIRQQVSLQGGSPAQNGSGSFGSVNGNTNGVGSGTPSSFGTGFGGSPTASPTGSTPGLGQGSGSQGGSTPAAPSTP